MDISFKDDVTDILLLGVSFIVLFHLVVWQAGTSNGVVVPARQAENRFLGS